MLWVRKAQSAVASQEKRQRNPIVARIPMLLRCGGGIGSSSARRGTRPLLRRSLRQLCTAAKPRAAPGPSPTPANPGFSLHPRRFNLGVKSDDGVPLTPGSWLAWAHEQARKHCHQGLVHHLSRAMMLVSVFTNDWAVVRLSLMAGCSTSMLFHFLFPTPRPARMAWGAGLLVGHAVALYHACKERLPIQLSEEEEELYDECGFRRAGFTRWHFRRIIELGTLETVEAGELVCEECEPNTRCLVVLDGSTVFGWRRDAEIGMSSHLLKRTDRAAWDAAKVHKGPPMAATRERPHWVGGIYEPGWYSRETLERLRQSQGDEIGTHRIPASLITLTSCTVLSFPRRELYDLIERFPLMREAALRLRIEGLRDTAKAINTGHTVLEARLRQVEERNAQLEALLGWNPCL